MKALRPFFMEDWLESFRNKAVFNMGESGGRPRTVKELLEESGYSENSSFTEIMNLPLFDSPNRGREDLRKLVADMHSSTSTENVLITTGTSEALFLLFRYLKPKKVAIPIPAFQLLYEIPAAMGALIIPLPIRYNLDGVPFLDINEWMTILDNENPDCIIINNPHNPTGLVFSEEILEKIVHYSNKNNCYLIGDEHYRFLSSEQNILGNSLYCNKQNIFITGSFIKCFGCPGLRIGWCIGNKQALDSIQNEKNYTTHTVNPFSEWLSYKVLLQQDSNLFKKIKNEWLINRETLKQFLVHSKTLYGITPEGGLVTVLGLKNIDDENALNNKMELLLSNGIFVLPLSSMEFGKFNFQNNIFYKEIKLSLINKGFGFRLGLGIDPNKFKVALDRMEQILN
ncbi:pyridoxal phosphate-dependent aminotransferase [Pigmentibacter sp. JX0631]|uniref:pyridoxal phosphate-dependent aminotransferase n=1 Tax=Pigmentibacter sp. JX0631 TaxID=2976982 RepID=UPI0024688A6A|nr:pyridoxal phosphate-dependent aminotransferase [Pigmentibacter sp. JX0631]WGL59650.1 pyridoxal phosphate-dependent aminotransferase [Pigmentibacter sp. JX0631]